MDEMYLSCPWLNSVVVALFSQWGFSDLHLTCNQLIINSVLLTYCIPLLLLLLFLWRKVNWNTISNQKMCSFKPKAIIRMFSPLSKIPSSVDFILQWTHLPTKEFRGCWNGDRNATTLDRPDNRRPEKACLKDSIVLEPAGPEPSARQHSLLSINNSNYGWHAGLNVASYMTKGSTDRGQDLQCKWHNVDKDEVVYNKAKTINVNKNIHFSVLFSSKLLFFSWNDPNYCFWISDKSPSKDLELLIGKIKNLEEWFCFDFYIYIFTIIHFYLMVW